MSFVAVLTYVYLINMGIEEPNTIETAFDCQSFLVGCEV